MIILNYKSNRTVIWTVLENNWKTFSEQTSKVKIANSPVKSCIRAVSKIVWPYKTICTGCNANNKRIIEVGHWALTPISLSTTGGMGRESNTFFKR